MEWLGLGEKEMSVQAGIISPGQVAKPGLKINIYSRGITQSGTKGYLQSRLVIPAGTKDPCHAEDRWARTFSPGWYYEPGLKGPLVPTTKIAEANAKLEHRSKICYLVVHVHSMATLIDAHVDSMNTFELP